MTVDATAGRSGGTRIISVPLRIGIALAPYIFAWFLLRRGYSASERVVAFAWMALLVFLIATQHRGAPPAATGQPAEAHADASVPAHSGPDPIAGPFVKKVLGEHLLDPESAKLTDMMEYRTGKRLTYCGQVNAKNRFGGYTGPVPFILSDDGIFVGDNATAEKVMAECQGAQVASVPDY